MSPIEDSESSREGVASEHFGDTNYSKDDIIDANTTSVVDETSQVFEDPVNKGKAKQKGKGDKHALIAWIREDVVAEMDDDILMGDPEDDKLIPKVIRQKKGNEQFLDQCESRIHTSILSAVSDYHFC